MSYASRLIADSAPPVRATAPPPVARLDVDVIAEAGKPAMVIPMEPSIAERPLVVPRPSPHIGSSDVEVRHAAAGPDTVRPIQPQFQPAETVSRIAAPPALATPTPEAPSVLDRLASAASTPPNPAHTPPPAGATEVETPELAAVRPPASEVSVELPDDEGVAWRRLSGTDLATGTGAARDTAIAPAVEPPGLLAVTRPADDAPSRDLATASRRDPEMESVTLSIGSIEVIVDGGSSGTIPPPVIAAPPPPAARAIDDPIMRLRRQYVTWPDGD